MNDEDFIEDSYLDASAENGSHTISPQPSSYFAIDSDNGSDEDGKSTYRVIQVVRFMAFH